MNKIQELEKMGLINPPSWLSTNMVYLGITGSTAYGCASENSKSDFDCYGITIPKKCDIWTHLPPRNEIPGFGRQIQRFEQWQSHAIFSKNENGGKGREYDFQVFSIVKFFQLALENNPNILDVLWLPQDCILYINSIGQMIRENRKLFLHKGLWHKFKGYAYSSLHKAKTKEHQGVKEIISFEINHNIPRHITMDDVLNEISYRIENNDISKDSPISHLDGSVLNEYKKLMENSTERGLRVKVESEDWKFLYHTVRLADECYQLLSEGDLDLRRSSEQLKSIRRGEWTFEQIEDYFNFKERQLEELYHSSTVIPYKPDEDEIKKLLMHCLEMHYGSLNDVYIEPDKYAKALAEVKRVIERAGL